MDKKETGQFGENLAIQYLQKKGYKILDKNFTYFSRQGKKFGEIDIVAEKEGIIVFFEIKTQKENKYFDPSERINSKKIKRMQNLAEIWLRKHRLGGRPFEIDLITILLDFENKKAKIEHFKNI
ncbi:MAG: YraN family protein [Candidatus Pacebacteria bacterium]|nr:YraN family protein [Candidatus Paceibacterota bacterium]